MFGVTFGRRDDIEFLRCRGELTAGKATSKLVSAAADMNVDDVTAVVCDLTEVGEVDHTGLVVLLTTREHLRLKERRLIFLDPHDHLSAVLAGEHGSQFVEVAADEVEALKLARA